MRKDQLQAPSVVPVTDPVIQEGATLISRAELLLGRSFDSHVSWRHLYKIKDLRDEEIDLQKLFVAHREYASNNIGRQLDLVIDTGGTTERSNAEMRVLESQKQTIETLIKTCTDIVYIHRGEVSAMRSNLLAAGAIFTAVLVMLALKA